MVTMITVNALPTVAAESRAFDMRRVDDTLASKLQHAEYKYEWQMSDKPQFNRTGSEEEYCRMLTRVLNC